MPEHTHADQWEFVIAGRAELHRDGGTEVFATGGQFLRARPGSPTRPPCTPATGRVIVFDAPDRYRPKEGD